MNWVITFTASGSEFRPSQVGYDFSKAIEPGSIGLHGRYKGIQVPYGLAVIECPTEPVHAPETPIIRLCNIALKLRPALQQAGATEFEISISRGYSDQCNEEFSATELKALSALDCSLSYSAYKTDPPCPTA